MIYLGCWFLSSVLIALLLRKPFAGEGFAMLFMSSVLLATAFPLTIPVIIIARIKERLEKNI